MDLEARPATVADLATLVTLAQEFWAEQRVARGGVLWAQREGPQPPPDADAAVEERYREQLNAVDCLTVVGTIDNAILGYAVVTIEVIPDGSRIGYISELFVEPAARAVSVGDTMIELVSQWCQSNGCLGIDAYALPGERLTKNFFEAHGFKARLLTMHHRFD